MNDTNDMTCMTDSGGIDGMNRMTRMNGIDNMIRMCYIDSERGKCRWTMILLLKLARLL
jgi:hypothetical protein